LCGCTRSHADRFWQPLAGWWGHAAPFAFTPDYQPAPGITRYLCGTQPIVSMALLGLRAGQASEAAETLGGMAALRAKSLALTDLFIAAGGRALRKATASVWPRRATMPSAARRSA